ncbi:MAG: hypothetical protein V1711_00035 [bacterium]
MEYKSLILGLGQKPDNPIPYSVTLRALSGQTFSVVGVRHVHDPKDPLILYIQDSFNKFLKILGPKIAIIEKRSKISANSLEEAVKTWGEAGATHWIATSESIHVTCPEPDSWDVTAELCKQFDPSDICYYEVGDAMSWHKRLHPELTAEENLERLLLNRVKHKDVYGFEPTVEWFMKKHESLFGNQSIDDESFWKATMNSKKSVNTVFGKILTARHNTRNQIIFDNIANLWNQGNNIFMVYGNSHITSLEPALRALVEN